MYCKNSTYIQIGGMEKKNKLNGSEKERTMEIDGESSLIIACQANLIESLSQDWYHRSLVLVPVLSLDLAKLTSEWYAEYHRQHLPRQINPFNNSCPLVYLAVAAKISSAVRLTMPPVTGKLVHFSR
jgi:hypothetical protein